MIALLTVNPYVEDHRADQGEKMAKAATVTWITTQGLTNGHIAVLMTSRKRTNVVWRKLVRIL